MKKQVAMKVALKLASGVVAGMLLSASASASVELVTNGGFETGSLSGWSTSNLGSGTCPSHPQDFNVSSFGSATRCDTVSNPYSGHYAAYVMNDGTGPLTYKLWQSFDVAAGTVGGEFSFAYSELNSSDRGRNLEVTLTNNATSAVDVLYNASTYSSDPSWHLFSADASAFLAAASGDTVTLSIDNYIPHSWTGPAGLGIDNVSVLATETNVPEPGSIALLGLGFAGLVALRRKRA
jgi:hypothetical protein